MMGVQIALERGFHVLIATGEDMDEPRGLISFSNTPLGEEFRSTVLKEKIMISLILTFTVLLALYWFIDLVFILLIILLSDFLVFRNFKSISNLPLAVNLNHPFMESEPVGKSGYMNWEQIKEVASYDFAYIGNHSHTHEYLLNFPYLEFENDIKKSMKIFKEKLGYNSIFFSYPFGEYNLRQTQFIKKKFKNEIPLIYLSQPEICVFNDMYKFININNLS